VEEQVYNQQQQQPIPQIAPKIIKEPGAFYSGKKFAKFLM
jgi:hypothetical protein